MTIPAKFEFEGELLTVAEIRMSGEPPYMLRRDMGWSPMNVAMEGW